MLKFSRIFNELLVKQIKNVNESNYHRVLQNSRHYSRETTERDWDFVDLDVASYEKICSETIDGLTDYFEEIVENANHLESSDVQYGDGVLTVNLGQPYGTYVINRQTPNKQIWLSSPTSGPKRYDFLGPKNAELGKWIYKHNGESLHELLQREVKEIMRTEVDFFQLPYGS